MKRWREFRIGDLGRVVTGRTPPSTRPELFGTVYPFVTPTDIDGQERRVVAARCLSEAGRMSMERVLVPANSIAYVCIASVGKVCMVDRTSVTNQQINTVVVDRTMHDAAFVFYALREATPRIRSMVGGAATPIINKSTFSNITLRLPCLEEQCRIGAILSAYDDLIENNTRRIAILEEMARRVYEEWFVRFRFPGHEGVRMVESGTGLVPEGWKRTNLSDLCRSIEDGDWVESKDQGGEDFRLLQISNIGINRFVETGNHRFISSETFKRLRCREIVPGQLLIARMPTPIGRAWLVTPKPWKMITAVDVAIAEADASKTAPEFLLHYLNSDATLAAFATQASGTTRLRITRRQIADMPLLAPPPALAHRFGEIVRPMNDLIALQTRRSETLRSTRDLLLPRLVSGELDVSALSQPRVRAA